MYDWYQKSAPLTRNRNLQPQNLRGHLNLLERHVLPVVMDNVEPEGESVEAAAKPNSKLGFQG